MKFRSFSRYVLIFMKFRSFSQYVPICHEVQVILSICPYLSRSLGHSLDMSLFVMTFRSFSRYVHHVCFSSVTLNVVRCGESKDSVHSTKEYTAGEELHSDKLLRDLHQGLPGATLARTNQIIDLDLTRMHPCLCPQSLRAMPTSASSEITSE